MDTRIPDGPTLRRHGGGAGPSLVVFGGSTYRDADGVWSPTAEWLCRRLIGERPDLCVTEVRYRHSSWRRLGAGVADGHMALAALVGQGLAPSVLIGFSFGGTVAIGVAATPGVTTVIGLAAWIPDGLDLRTLTGRRLRLMHGTLDAALPGVPGVPQGVSERGLARARALGVDAELRLIRGGVHGLAVRVPWGLAPLPRARRWVASVLEEVERAP